MSNAGRRAVTDLRDSDVERLLAGRLHDPRRVLGAHALPNGETVVRALLPYAARAELVLPSAPLERVGSTALFEWRGASANLPERYRVRWHDGADAVYEAFDPYCFPPLLALERLERFNQGSDDRAYRCLGAHVVTADGVAGVRFAVWAPNAERVSVVGEFNRWDGRCHPLAVRGSTGIWELFVPELPPGTLYKYELRNRDTGELRIKADPFGARFERRPATAGIVAAPSRYAWQDRDWLAARAERDWLRAPMSIYEVHLGSWRRGPNGEFLSYRHLAEALGAYVEDLGFTHVELMPVTEHPLDDSWGYQCTGYFAPTSRHGEPDDLRAFVDSLHARGIGVLLDWVPGHFPKDDHALARFDGTALYEYADTRKGVQPDWDTLVFDYARNEVQSFLVSSAVYWLDEFHFDGLRVDAVASMLYLDYSRKDGGWTPNVHGGNENLEAIAFLKRLNETTHAVLPGTVTVAEESTSWPMVSRPTYTGGLGFTLKWNMGWMHDTLEYLAHDPVHRKYHHNLLTFGPVYAFSENFVLPLSHDEMVHGKRSLVGKTPGDEWQRFANLRLLLTYQWTYPGKKLLFMGGELGVPWEWSHADPLPWELAERPPHSGVRALIRDLNRCYRSLPALHAADHDGHGFAWLSWTDHENSVLSYVRRHEEDHAIVLLNFTPVPREAYRVGAPRPGRYRVALNSDSEFYGGSNAGVASVDTEPVPAMGHAQSVALTLPPLAGLILVPVHEPR